MQQCLGFVTASTNSSASVCSLTYTTQGERTTLCSDESSLCQQPFKMQCEKCASIEHGNYNGSVFMAENLCYIYKLMTG